MSFSIDNLPYGIASSPAFPKPQCVTRFEDNAVLLAALQQAGIFSHINGLPEAVFNETHLNAFASLPKSIHHQVREALQKVLQDQSKSSILAQCMTPVSGCTLHLPIQVGDFSDFSCSKEHNIRAGEIILGSSDLPPAFWHYPIGYTGRSSSIVVSGNPTQRPLGLFKDVGQQQEIVFGPSAKVDFELEVGCVIGKPVETGKGCPVSEAEQHIFGFVLLNDWSARDVQALEMRPLGPLNGKSFGTTISPWIVTLEALKPFEQDAIPFQQQPAPYLQCPVRKTYSFGLQVEVIRDGKSTTVGKSRAEWMYWTYADMIAHQTVNGCSLRTGDILATGTISGFGEDEKGCLLESTFGGEQPLTLADGGSLEFLEDGDIVRFTGHAGKGDADSKGISFGECIGELVPARSWVA